MTRRDPRRRLGRNFVIPHTHHPRDVPGGLQIVDIGANLVPFDPRTITVDAASYNGLTFDVIPDMTLTVTLPPINTPSNKWRVMARFDATLEAATGVIGELRLFQDGVGVGPLRQWGDDIGASADYQWPTSLFTTFEAAPGTYVWDIRWRSTTVVDDISIRPNQNLFTIQADRLVVD